MRYFLFSSKINDLRHRLIYECWGGTFTVPHATSDSIRDSLISPSTKPATQVINRHQSRKPQIVMAALPE